MANDNIPEPIFPSGFLVETVITPETLETLSKTNSAEIIEFAKSRDKSILELHNKKLEITRDTQNKAETTKRFGMGLVFSVIVSVLVYSGVTGDKALTDKVLIAAISAFGGVGGASLLNQQKEKDK
jgi:hypothetical protein